MVLIDFSTRWSHVCLFSTRNVVFTRFLAQMIKIRVIGVNHTSIYSVFSLFLCNLNARFTPIFLKITLIPICLCFVGIESKASKEEGKKSKKVEVVLEGIASPRRS